MTPEQVTWTPTAAELDELVAVASRRSFLTTGLPGFVVATAVALVIGAGRGWALCAVIVVLAALVAAWSRHAGGRTVRRVLATSYPVGTEVSSEATEEALLLHTAVGVLELPWARLVRAKPGPVVVAVKDGASRQWLVVPRQLFPEAWLARVGVPAAGD